MGTPDDHAPSPADEEPSALEPAAEEPVSGAPSSSGGGSSFGLTAAFLLAVSAAAVFWAGLSLGGISVGRTDSEQAAIDAFTKTYRQINDQYVGAAEPGDVLQGAIRGMIETLDDPYSTYMSPDEYTTTLADINGEFEGIGARMDTEDEEGVTCEPIGEGCQLRVVDVLPDSPALEAGLQAADVVTAVDGRSLEGQTINDAVTLIRGPRGSDVTLTLLRGRDAQDLTITRDVIVSSDVRSAVLADGAVGYLRIDGFSGTSDDDFATALRAHLDAGIDRLIVDLRDDPGGFVEAAVEITSQFLPDGAVFWEESADGSQRSIDVSGDGLAHDPDIEVVVLVDDGTASASEILAGALQDAGRAQLVGQPTFGKGTVQEWTELPSQTGGFRLSVAKWLTRDRSSIDGVGLTPDVLVDDGSARYRPGIVETDPEADIQLRRAISILLGEAVPGPSPEPRSSSTPAA